MGLVASDGHFSVMQTLGRGPEHFVVNFLILGRVDLERFRHMAQRWSTWKLGHSSV